MCQRIGAAGIWVLIGASDSGEQSWAISACYLYKPSPITETLNSDSRSPSLRDRLKQSRLARNTNRILC